MRTYVAVVAEGSFSAAARKLDMSPQLVSKYVAQLEERLGVRLLNRSTRRLSITEAGRACVDRCRQVLADIDDMESLVGDLSARPAGTLRVNAPMSFGVTHLTPAVAAYQARYTEVAVELDLNDRTVDVISEGYDLAVRIALLPDSSLVGRRRAPARRVLCAAPEYLKRHGTPTTPDALADHNCLGYTYFADGGAWRFTRDDEVYTVPVAGSFRTNNGDALSAAALAGTGIVVQPTFIVGDALRAGRLVPLLPDYTLAERSVYAVYAHRQYLSAKVRTFVDHLATYFGTPPYWDRYRGPLL
ncbi:MAG: LysR family transcriptional regulator [Pseudomonadota bacterium]